MTRFPLAIRASAAKTMSERRVKTERRKKDIGPPPGCFERRKSPDRRLPVAEETAISDAEFQLLFGAANNKALLDPASAHEEAAAVLERAGNY